MPEARQKLTPAQLSKIIERFFDAGELSLYWDVGETGEFKGVIFLENIPGFKKDAEDL